MRRLCGDTAACVNIRRPFFILRSTRSFRTAHPASSCGSARRARRFRLFPGGHSPFSPSLVVLVPFPSSRRPRAALPGCFPSCRRHSRTASRMMRREHRPSRIKPRRLRRVRMQQLRRNAEHPRGPTLNCFSSLCSSAALRASSDKNALVGSHRRQNVFSRLHCPVRGIPSSEKTRTLRGYAAFSPPKAPSPARAAPPPWMCSTL